MKYILMAKCDVCGKSGVYEGDSKNNRKDILNIALKAGMNHITAVDKMVCQSCYDEYYRLQQLHKTEIEDFLRGEKRQEG